MNEGTGAEEFGKSNETWMVKRGKTAAHSLVPKKGEWPKIGQPQKLCVRSRKTKQGKKGAFPKFKVNQRPILKAASVALYSSYALPIPVSSEVYKYLQNSL